MMIILFFVAKPYFLMGQTTPDVEANEGDNVNLLCNATGRPNPTIIWSRFGGALLPIGQERLYVSTGRLQFTDMYVCSSFR